MKRKSGTNEEISLRKKAKTGHWVSQLDQGCDSKSKHVNTNTRLFESQKPNRKKKRPKKLKQRERLKTLESGINKQNRKERTEGKKGSSKRSLVSVTLSQSVQNDGVSLSKRQLKKLKVMEKMHPGSSDKVLQDLKKSMDSKVRSALVDKTTKSDKLEAKSNGNKKKTKFLKKKRKHKLPTKDEKSKVLVDEDRSKNETDNLGKEKDISEKSKFLVGMERSKDQDKIVLPRNAEDFSCNWKQLQTVLHKESPPNSSKKKPFKRKHSDTDTKVTTAKFNRMAFKSESLQVKRSDMKPEIWFDIDDDIVMDSLKKSDNKSAGDEKEHNPLVKPDSFHGLTKVVAMDCEMVGTGWDSRENMLARVSLVNQYGQCVYDKYVRPVEEVTDYRTHVSGIRKEDLDKGEDFAAVQKAVSDMLKGRMLVGHALQNDLKVLYLSHPKKKIRDTSRYKPFRQLFSGKTPSLKKLSEQVLSVAVQEGEHSSVQDAQAAMRLYTMYRKQWEKDIKFKFRKTPKEESGQ